MSMEQQIQQDIKAAMLAKEKTRLESLRAIKAAITLAKTADGSESIADEAVVKIIQKLVKQRKETAEIYKQQNREELAAQELAEAAAMEVYLPKQLSEEELEAELATAEKTEKAIVRIRSMFGIGTRALTAKEKEMIDALRCRNGNLEITVSRQDTTVTEL